ncbi:MAG: response regulator transcription factor, partial [Synergistaceae bacterium]|nr:response regulator transcription factor [Synergistaceae bacterium]
MSHAVLLVEDDRHIMKINQNTMSKMGYRVLKAVTLSEAARALEAEKPDLIVLDILLPDGNGIEWCRGIRGDSHMPPILFLSSRNDTIDILEGLKAGGDDYLTKPYDLDIFLARAELLLQRASRVPEVVKKGTLRLEITSQQAFLRGENMGLSPKEFALLLNFAQNEDKIISAETMYKKIWGQPMSEDNQ